MKYFNRVLFSDIDPFEVVKVKSEKTIVIREMQSELTNRENLNETFVSGGFCGHFDNSIQEWNITSFENAPRVIIRLHKNGEWRDRNGIKYTPSDEPYKFYDFNF